MRNALLYTAVVLGVVLAVAAIYFGSLLPFAKSRAYIAAERNLGNVGSVPEFITNLDRAMRFRSPVGGEETVKFLASKVLDIVSSIELPEKDALALIVYVDQRLFREDTRHRMIGGHLWTIMLRRFPKEDYFLRAEEHFLAAHGIGPELPTPLYALYALYRDRGDEAKAREYREKIEALWPEVRDIPGYFEQ